MVSVSAREAVGMRGLGREQREDSGRTGCMERWVNIAAEQRNEKQSKEGQTDSFFG